MALTNSLVASESSLVGNPHLAVCPFRGIPCPDCKFTMARKDLDTHSAKQCPLRGTGHLKSCGRCLVHCKKCNAIVSRQMCIDRDVRAPEGKNPKDEEYHRQFTKKIDAERDYVEYTASMHWQGKANGDANEAEILQMNEKQHALERPMDEKEKASKRQMEEKEKDLKRQMDEKEKALRVQMDEK
ncbi:hypothetical protein pdam_00023211 [Pocillopora damicornis]|uniref:TRAF-type domain-containing protein n=1 Tax=Pocillopora damicornis TaxID=46731 RepID=A0A3M6UN37_POCDA|nr:hypothetical protein pdam_00023211 [Pocillopora damicornis]